MHFPARSVIRMLPAKLIEQIAAHFSLTPEHISLGNGSSETIQAAVQMLVAEAQKNSSRYN